MNATDFEKLAGQLAEIATVSGFEKTAAGGGVAEFLNSDAGRYLIGGLGGAGAGAILGAAQPDKEKRTRNMLYYGTLGGIGGLGVAHLTNSLGGMQAPAAASTPAARAAQQKAETAAAVKKELAENFPVAGATAGLTAGAASNRYVGRPIAKAVEQSAAGHTQKLDAAQARAAREMQAQHVATRKNVADAFDKRLTAVGKQHARALFDADVKARAAAALTGVPAHVTLDKLRAQQAAQIARMNRNYTAATGRLSGTHAAAEAADAANFAKRMGRRNFGLGALNLALRLGIPAAGTYGGFHAPDAAQQYIYGE